MKNPKRCHSYPLALPIIVALVGTACATTTPVELSNARAAYRRASDGPAAQHNPADLHKAKTALDEAEHNFIEEKNSKKTVDLAYIAQRTAQIAEARAATAVASKSSANAKLELGATQEAMTKTAQGALASSREQLGAAERAQAQQATQAGADRAAREQADQQRGGFGAEGCRRRPQDKGGQRRAGKAGGEGGRAGPGHYALGQRPVSIQRCHLDAGRSDPSRSGGRCPGGQGA